MKDEPIARRRGKKGEGSVEIRLQRIPSTEIVTLSAYEVRAAYRALYSESKRGRRRR